MTKLFQPKVERKIMSKYQYITKVAFFSVIMVMESRIQLDHNWNISELNYSVHIYNI